MKVTGRKNWSNRGEFDFLALGVIHISEVRRISLKEVQNMLQLISATGQQTVDALAFLLRLP